MTILASQVQQLTDEIEAGKKVLDEQRKQWETRELQFKVKGILPTFNNCLESIG